MKVAIHQPQYWPWPPYLHKILSADVFIYLDSVQFTKNGLQNRNQIKGQNGALWLTVPVVQQLGQTIAETRLADERSLGKHAKTLQASYARTPGYKRWKDELNALFAARYPSLSAVAMATTEWMLEKCGASTVRRRSSALTGVDPAKHGSELVAELCRQLGATDYLTGRGALDYMVPEHFSAIGCDVSIQAWKPLAYAQTFPEKGFVPDLSALDLLLNFPDEAPGMICAAGGWETLWKVS